MTPTTPGLKLRINWSQRTVTVIDAAGNEVETFISRTKATDKYPEAKEAAGAMGRRAGAEQRTQRAARNGYGYSRSGKR